MKNSIFVYVVIGFMAGALFTGCSKTSEQKVQNAKVGMGETIQEVEDTQAGYHSEWQTFKSEYEQKIELTEKMLAGFKQKTEKAGPEFKEKYSKEVAVLEQKNDDLKMKLANYKDEGQSKWEEFKTSFKEDMDGIGKTMEALFKETV